MTIKRPDRNKLLCSSVYFMWWPRGAKQSRSQKTFVIFPEMLCFALQGHHKVSQANKLVTTLQQNRPEPAKYYT